MEMRCREDIEGIYIIGQDLTPPLYPIAFSLYNSHLLSHCSACFSPLPLSTSDSPPPIYCSSLCSSSDSPLHFLSAEHHLLISSTRCPHSDSSTLRAALRLLHRSISVDIPLSDRIRGLLTNRDALIEDDDEVCKEIKEGAEAMAAARRLMMMMREEGVDRCGSGDCVMEEAALCVVMTNAVEVQDKNGVAVGIAVYDTTFSWINHSCSPNACYRFSGFTDDSPLLIAATGGYGDTVSKGWERYGPRIGVRNIKAISKGEEITIAYTDLLQAKETRQTDLWFKYRFICHCRRCSTLPLAYVDHALQDIHVSSLASTNMTSTCNVYKDEAVEILTKYIDGAIGDYVKFDDAESCCEKLEHVLAYGLTNDHSLREGKLWDKIRLQPLHHLSLNAYTALASTYKALGSNLLDLNTNIFKHQLYAFDKSKISAAYSLLLAGATHYLFLFEYSLIISVANFWTAAGESLLSLASSAVANTTDQSFPVPKLSPLKLRCDKCVLKDKLEASFVSSSQNLEFEHISGNFLNCITDLAPQVWIFLIQGSHHLSEIKNPINFTWLGNTKDSKVPDFGANLGSSDNIERSFSICQQEGYGNQRIKLFELGAHCLLYGEFILKICCGKDLQVATLS